MGWLFKRRGVVAGLSALALGGCGLGEPAVPAEVERLVEAKFPGDGQIHVQARGKFVVTKQTVFCRAPRNIAVSLKDAAPTFYNPGIDDVENAELGEVVKGRPCVNDGTNIVNHWSLVPNRDGEPYRLVLAVWQGDPANGGALWVGGVERMEGKLHPRPTVRLPINPAEVPLRRRDLLAGSVASDVGELSDQFTAYLTPGPPAPPVPAGGFPPARE